ncbi:Hsp20/alpha crystallin family protein [Desertibacillus haloalkaliphilus]|uniref:Hsp20/alpha crystallin family protein n=1 Tax=Desertibacillus haloalkaliphilus TaxID=1328930 RepID=UPI001C268CCF|nr:Hsp20/alpha crystallin family protein [Desertibacillus haloalkaliphilus]MBU8907453.1 Hsp20/alpha crystallin family protein [Desertibacillus haloalkaliphilus]
MGDKNERLPKQQQKPYSDLLKSIDNFFTETFKNFHDNGLFAPSFPVHMYETDQYYMIEAELPGVKKEQIQLDIYQNHVRIGVEHQEIINEEDQKNDFFHQQRSYQRRERTIPLPFTISEKDAKARYANGLLTIKIPNKRKTIDIE